MKKQHKKPAKVSLSTAEEILRCIEDGGDRVWRLSDFRHMPSAAVAQALSRLARSGTIQRFSKGIYYRPRQTPFGLSKPTPGQLHSLNIERKEIFPAGNAAANLLGFTTQNAAKIEVATNGLSLPRSIVGKDTIIHTRRPESWKNLSTKDAAILDFLRQGGRTSELMSNETVKMLLIHFHEKSQFKRLVQVASSEPPRVRAMLGAIGQQIGCQKSILAELRKSLNPLSKFDFGNLIALKYAKQWRAKETDSTQRKIMGPRCDLSTKKCVPCQGGVPPLKGAALSELHRQLGGDWKVVDEHHLEKEYVFKNFQEALAFTNAIGAIAEEEGHHPDILLRYGKVKVELWTHKINGLTESDFILAAKIDRI